MNTNPYAKSLTTDSWKGGDCEESVIDRPREADLLEAIDRLDERVYTLVIVGGEGEAHLAVGGGRGRFVVYATFDNRTFHNLVERGRPGGVITIVAGGQAGEYPACQVVDRERAIRAASRFLSEGRLGEDLGWEVQP